MIRPWLFLSVVVVMFFAGGTANAADPAAAKLLTPDAKGFVHVRVADIWEADVTKQLRAFAAQAGPNLLGEFDSRFYPAPSDVESFTVILFDMKFREIMPAGRPTDLTPVWVVTSKKALDRSALLKTMAKTGKLRKHNGKDYYFDETQWSGLLIIDERTYAYASEDSITALIDRMAKGGASPLAAVFTREAEKHPITVGVNPTALVTAEMLKELPPDFQAVVPLFKAKAFVAMLDLKPKTTISAALEFGTEAEAKDGLKAAQETVQLARGQIGQALIYVEQKAKGDPAKPKVGVQEFPQTVGFILAAAGLKQVDALLGAMPLEVKGSAVRASMEIDSIVPGGSTAISIATVAIAIGYAMSESDFGGRIVRSDDYELVERERNLREIAKAIEKYRQDKGHYPPPAILDKEGKPILSWRVAILPYMENVWINGPFEPGAKPINGAQELYKMFKMDEPWDSPHNKKLIDKLPSLYRAPWTVLPYNQSSLGKTVTLAVVGKGAIFDPTKKTVNDTDVRDGLKHTLLLMSVEEANQAVYWTKPADIMLTAEGKLPADGANISRRFAVVYGDGSAHTLANGLTEKVFLGIVSREGNEKLDLKEIRPDPIKPKNGGFPEPGDPPPPPK